MLHRTVLFPWSYSNRAFMLMLLASTAFSPSVGHAVEGYNISEGSEWATSPSQPKAQQRRFTDFSGSAPRATAPIYSAAPMPSAPAPQATSTPSTLGLPSIEPITLTPPASARATSQPVNLAETTVPSTAEGYVAPVSDIIMPSQPLYPARSGNTETAMPTYNALVSGTQAARVATPPSKAKIDAEPAIADAVAVKAATPAPITLVAPQPAPSSPEPVVAAAVATAAKPKTPATVPAAPAVKEVPAAASSLTIASAPAESTASHIAQLPPPPAMTSSQAARVAEASNTVSAAPEVLGTPIVSAEPAVISAPPLTNESKKILSSLQPQAKASGVERAKRVDVKRVSPEVADIVKKAEEVYESAGVSIRVSSPQLDSTTELERAYESLMGGDTEVAIRIYQDLLRRNPGNEEALFGLAATYHRTGQIENARPLYGRLLAQNPQHREALNNFLMLVANESPREALSELAQLENRNPSYSPIPAQMGIIYDRLGEPEVARSKMLRAIELSPENWTYKYNLAVMLDRRKAYADAAAIYREIIEASLQGEPMSMDMKALQARLNYISARTGNS